MPKGVFPTEQFTSDGVSKGIIGDWQPSGGFHPYQTDQQILKQFMDFGSSDDLYLDLVSPPFQSIYDDEYSKLVNVESPSSEFNVPMKKTKYVLPSASFEILKKYGSRSKRLSNEKVDEPIKHYRNNSSDPTLSAEVIIQLAAEKFIQSSYISGHELSHPYPVTILANATPNAEEVHLVQNLLSSAEKVGEKQYERAIKLLRECDKMSSNRGSAVQRLVYYFTEALYEKIDRETGRITPEGIGKKMKDPMEALKCQDSTLIALHSEMPLSQITKFAGVQALVEHIAEASKVHVIDLEIRNGIHCTILMQALASRSGNPIEHLRITVVGTKSKENIQETGRHLTSFAESLNLPFSFDVVMVEDILDLNIQLLRLDNDEAVTIYAAYTLTAMIRCPDKLEHLMRVIKSINPQVMIFTEIEANCNSPIFVDRFVEALFYYGAFFDYLADCFKYDEKHRSDAESTFFSSAIRNIVAAKGEERKVRHVSISVWRSFFQRFGLMEIELSMSSMYQASLVLKKFTCGNNCTFDMNGKCIIMGWKGTRLFSLSAWKFQ